MTTTTIIIIIAADGRAVAAGPGPPAAAARGRARPVAGAAAAVAVWEVLEVREGGSDLPRGVLKVFALFDGAVHTLRVRVSRQVPRQLFPRLPPSLNHLYPHQPRLITNHNLNQNSNLKHNPHPNLSSNH